MSDNSRLEALELAVARLTKEMVSLRSEVRRLGERGGAAGGAAGDAVAGGPPQKPISPSAADSFAPSDRSPDRSNAATPRSGDREGTSAGASASSGGSEPFVSDELRRIAAGVSLAPRRSPGGSATEAEDVAAGGAAAGGGAGRPGSHTGRRTSDGVGAGAGIGFGTGRPATAWPAQRGDLERLVGRYGTLALAALTILMGVGAFLGWAVRNGLIGPELRVALGAITATVVAIIGWRLRRGNSPRFGNVLLGLALAIIHVVSWGAGPLLNLVSDGVALAVAAAASVALAVLSLREEDQSLFNVGFGGALLAPFVTSSGDGNPLLLLTYGAFVLAAGMHAMRDREWEKVPFVQMLGIVVYTVVATEQLMRDGDWTRGAAPALFGIAVAWAALIIVRGATRGRLSQVALVSALGSLAVMFDQASTDWPRVALALVVTITAYASALPNERTIRSRILVGVAIPMFALAVALSTLPSATSGTGGLLAGAWCVAAAVSAWINRDGERSTHAFTATLLANLALTIPDWNSNVQIGIRVAIAGALASVLLPRLRLVGMALGTFIWLSIGAIAVFSALDARTTYAYRPFLTEASLGSAAVSLAWLLFSWFTWRYAAEGRFSRALPRAAVVRLLGATVTFFWIHQELAGAFSHDVATFLLVAYYALTGVLAIGVGRWRAIPLLRQVGLGLSVLAALKAIIEASALQIGWRVGGYMLAGLFLLGVAYWYRASGRGDEEREMREGSVPNADGDQIA